MSERYHGSRLGALGVLGVLLGALSACDTGGIVGGSCKPGVRCGGSGASGGSPGEAGEDAGAAGDAGGRRGTSPDYVDRPGGPGRGGVSGDAGGSSDAGAAGDGTAGADGQGASGSGGGGGATECEAPLVACGAECVDTNLNPLHCGGCFNACPSGICQAGECVGATTGHVAVYCMNYAAASAQSTHAVLLANAVFLPIRAEVRVLAFTRWAPAAARTRIGDLLRASAAQRGRSFALTELEDPAALSQELNVQSYDVFLLYEQSGAPEGELASVGAAWKTSLVLDSFARAGGVVIALDGAQGTGEMPELLSASGLLPVEGHRPLAANDTGTRFFNRAPADALAVNVLSPFSPIANSCTLETELAPSAETVFVVTDAASPAEGEPVVVHRIVLPTSP